MMGVSTENVYMLVTHHLDVLRTGPLHSTMCTAHPYIHTLRYFFKPSAHSKFDPPLLQNAGQLSLLQAIMNA